MQWLQEAALQVRARVGLPLGVEPTTDALHRIVDLFSDRVTLRYKRIAEPVTFHREDGTALIFLPSYLRGRELDFALCHETGHALWDNQLADYLIQQGDPALARLGRLAQGSNERQANEWVAALFGRHLARH